MAFLSVLVFCLAVTEPASGDDGAGHRAQALQDQFDCDPGSLHHRLADYFQASSGDSEWSPRAEIQLVDWFETSDNGGDVDVTCVAELCAVDFFVSFHEFRTTYRLMVEEWERAKHAGFMKVGFSFPRGDGSTRLFVFRDSFNPAALTDLSDD